MWNATWATASTSWKHSLRPVVARRPSARSLAAEREIALVTADDKVPANINKLPTEPREVKAEESSFRERKLAQLLAGTRDGLRRRVAVDAGAVGSPVMTGDDSPVAKLMDLRDLVSQEGASLSRSVKVPLTSTYM
jgi:hypothetical protein